MQRPTQVLCLSLLLAATSLAGCAAPCDQYCTVIGDYIEGCLEDGSQAEWAAVNDGGGWTYWGATSKDEYVADCQEDLAAQLDGPNDSDALTGACEDDANRYQEMADRGLCADLP